jgi:hypothetical protein
MADKKAKVLPMTPPQISKKGGNLIKIMMAKKMPKITMIKKHPSKTKMMKNKNPMMPS